MPSKPHGGELIDLTLCGEELEEEMERCKHLEKVRTDFDTLLDAEKIAIGAFSPLRGFMTREQLKGVVEDMRLPSGEVWSIPIQLSVGEETVRRLSDCEEIVLCDAEGNAICLLRVEDVYTLEREWVAEKVFGTNDTAHPAVARLQRLPDYCVGGQIRLLQRPYNPHRQYERDPKDIRKYFEEMGWKTVVGFQTRNAPHRAHEYLQRCALEVVDGLLIQPILGTKKGDDFSTEAIMGCYEVLVENYYPKERVLLSGLSTWMRYAGPREAVFHAIVRKNYGCTHFIVGRDHAGVGNYYDPYAAHYIFDGLPDMGIEILKVTAAFYCRKCEGMASDKTCGHGPKSRLNISMTAVRRMLSEAQIPPPELLRPQVVEVLMQHMRREQRVRDEEW